MSVYLTYGPPGCGKTTHLAGVAKRTSDQRGGKELLIGSLTRAAAAEIGMRDTGVPADHCGTLHSLCYHALGHPSIAEGKVKDWNAERPEWAMTAQSGAEDEVEQSLERSFMSKFEITGDDLLAAVQLLRARKVPRDQWRKAAGVGPFIEPFHQAWCEWKWDCGHLDFTDLIEQAIDRHPTPPKGASVMLFDEAQDYSALEKELCLTWADSARHTVFVGDVDQSCYEWRGADPRIFMDLGVPEDRKRVLGQSYRVPRAVCEYATRWIRQIEEREDVAYAPTGVPGSVDYVEARWGWPGDVMPFVEASEARGETLMLLTSCNYMLQPIIGHLRAEGVKFHNPYRRKNGMWNPIRRSNAKRVSAFDRLEAYLNMLNTNELASIRLWLEPLSSKILTKGAKKRATELRVGLTPADLRSLFVREEDFVQAMELDLDWYVQNVTASKRKPFEYPRQVLQRYGKLDDEFPNVIVGSCHSVKGGEADNVLLFPDISRAADESIVMGSFDPVCRQFYVGMTRAKNRLFLGKAMFGRRHHSVEWL